MFRYEVLESVSYEENKAVVFVERYDEQQRISQFVENDSSNTTLFVGGCGGVGKSEIIQYMEYRWNKTSVLKRTDANKPVTIFPIRFRLDQTSGSGRDNLDWVYVLETLRLEVSQKVAASSGKKLPEMTNFSRFFERCLSVLDTQRLKKERNRYIGWGIGFFSALVILLKATIDQGKDWGVFEIITNLLGLSDLTLASYVLPAILSAFVTSIVALIVSMIDFDRYSNYRAVSEFERAFGVRPEHFHDSSQRQKPGDVDLRAFQESLVIDIFKYDFYAALQKLSASFCLRVVIIFDVDYLHETQISSFLAGLERFSDKEIPAGYGAKARRSTQSGRGAHLSELAKYLRLIVVSKRRELQWLDPDTGLQKSWRSLGDHSSVAKAFSSPLLVTVLDEAEGRQLVAKKIKWWVEKHQVASNSLASFMANYFNKPGRPNRHLEDIVEHIVYGSSKRGSSLANIVTARCHYVLSKFGDLRVAHNSDITAEHVANLANALEKRPNDEADRVFINLPHPLRLQKTVSFLACFRQFNSKALPNFKLPDVDYLALETLAQQYKHEENIVRSIIDRSDIFAIDLDPTLLGLLRYNQRHVTFARDALELYADFAGEKMRRFSQKSRDDDCSDIKAALGDCVFFDHILQCYIALKDARPLRESEYSNSCAILNLVTSWNTGRSLFRDEIKTLNPDNDILEKEESDLDYALDSAAGFAAHLFDIRKSPNLVRLQEDTRLFSAASKLISEYLRYRPTTFIPHNTYDSLADFAIGLPELNSVRRDAPEFYGSLVELARLICGSLQIEGSLLSYSLSEVEDGGAAPPSLEGLTILAKAEAISGFKRYPLRPAVATPSSPQNPNGSSLLQYWDWFKGIASKQFLEANEAISFAQEMRKVASRIAARLIVEKTETPSFSDSKQLIASIEREVHQALFSYIDAVLSRTDLSQSQRLKLSWFIIRVLAYWFGLLHRETLRTGSNLIETTSYRERWATECAALLRSREDIPDDFVPEIQSTAREIVTQNIHAEHYPDFVLQQMSHVLSIEKVRPIAIEDAEEAVCQYLTILRGTRDQKLLALHFDQFASLIIRTASAYANERPNRRKAAIRLLWAGFAATELVSKLSECQSRSMELRRRYAIAICNELHEFKQHRMPESRRNDYESAIDRIGKFNWETDVNPFKILFSLLATFNPVPEDVNPGNFVVASASVTSGALSWDAVGAGDVTIKVKDDHLNAMLYNKREECSEAEVIDLGLQLLCVLNEAKEPCVINATTRGVEYAARVLHLFFPTASELKYAIPLKQKALKAPHLAQEPSSSRPTIWTGASNTWLVKEMRGTSKTMFLHGGKLKEFLVQAINFRRATIFATQSKEGGAAREQQRIKQFTNDSFKSLRIVFNPQDEVVFFNTQPYQDSRKNRTFLSMFSRVFRRHARIHGWYDPPSV